jgi:hypothetical protein
MCVCVFTRESQSDLSSICAQVRRRTSSPPENIKSAGEHQVRRRTSSPPENIKSAGEHQVRRITSSPPENIKSAGEYMLTNPALVCVCIYRYHHSARQVDYIPARAAPLYVCVCVCTCTQTHTDMPACLYLCIYVCA